MILNNWNTIASLVFGLAFVTGASANAQLVTDPLEIALSAGRPVSLVTIRNESEAAQQATVTMGDWDRAESGANRFYPAGTRHGSCGSRVKAFPVAVRVDPHATQIVRVALDSSLAADSECTSVVFVEQAAPAAAIGRFGVRYALRTAVKVYGLPHVMTREGEIDSIAVVRDTSATAGRAVVIGFRNTGSVHTLAHGTLEIRRPDNSVFTSLAIDDFPTLPGAHRTVTLRLPALPAGHYVALAVIDFGGADVAAGELEFEAAPGASH